MFGSLFRVLVAAFGIATASAAAAGLAPDALVFAAADLHSAYDRLPQLLGAIDRVSADYPRVPRCFLIDGDLFEGGNAVARRSGGAVEFAFLAALRRRGPTVVTLGNHEPEFFSMSEVVARLTATGVTVVSGNLRDRQTGRAFVPADAPLALAGQPAVITGFCTDRLATFRAEIRPTLAIDDPIDWARRELPRALSSATIPVVLSHAGLRADRSILPLVPDGTLYVGGHDHLAFVHPIGRTVYLHTGSWASALGVVELHLTEGKPHWTAHLQPITADVAADPELAALVTQTMAKNLTAEETAAVGRLAAALAPTEAARFVTNAARLAARADVAVIGATTFGGGLPAGEVSRYALDGCVRFDGPLFVGTISGADLRRLRARCNQGPETPFDERAGENLCLVGPDNIDPAREYRLATTDWSARNARNYLGEVAPALHELPDVRLKQAAIAALSTAAERSGETH